MKNAYDMTEWYEDGQRRAPGKAGKRAPGYKGGHPGGGAVPLRLPTGTRAF